MGWKESDWDDMAEIMQLENGVWERDHKPDDATGSERRAVGGLCE